MGTVYGYKAMLPDMTCWGFQFEVGKTYKVDNDNPLEVCSDSGFHFCQHFEDVFNFYNWYECRIFKVSTNSPVVTEEDKSITKEITILKEISREDLEYENLKSFNAQDYYKIMLENDKDLIYNTFKDSLDWGDRVAVVNSLTNEQLISEFKDDYHWVVRRAVVKRLSNEQFIFDTFKDDEVYSVRQAVIRRLTDEDLIYNTFKNDPHYGIRIAVIEKLTDKKLVLDTFKDDKDCDVRKEVVKKLTDEKLIFETFKNDPDWMIRFEVVNKLTDKKLIEFFKDDSDEDVRRAVQLKLRDK